MRPNSTGTAVSGGKSEGSGGFVLSLLCGGAAGGSCGGTVETGGRFAIADAAPRSQYLGTISYLPCPLKHRVQTYSS